jgi:hypothetical protein
MSLGNKCCPLCFFRTASGISSISIHLRLGGEDGRTIGDEERVGFEMVVGVIVREVGLA